MLRNLYNNNNMLRNLYNNNNINKYFTNKKYISYIKTFDEKNQKYIIDKIIERSDYTEEICKKHLKNEVISVLGYGSQGRAQSLNLRDQNYNVILGLRKFNNSWKQALTDGWIVDKNLFSIEEAAEKGSIIKYLLSDAAQISEWATIKRHLTKNKTLYFSHGFGLVYQNQTNITPPQDVNVIMVAPKGSGVTLRTNFINKKYVNSSYAIAQNATKNAEDLCLSLGFAIGSANIFETTFEKEVYSDLTGERGVLMGLIAGAFNAQYNVLRENEHSPAEAFNETVEEALHSLYPLIHEKGLDFMFNSCSSTAQRGALDWSKKYEEVLTPIIRECYNNVKKGYETEIVIKNNSDKNYKEKLKKELKEIDEKEIWRVGREIRKYRSEIKKESKTNLKKQDDINNNMNINYNYNDKNEKFNIHDYVHI